MLGLLSNKFSPITDEIGFVEAEPEAVRDWLVARASDDITGTRTGFSTLRTALSALLPLVYWPCRFLVVPTRSSWCAYFDNTTTGTDTSGVVGALSEALGTRAVRAVAVPNTIHGRRGRYGATIFTLYGPERREWLNVVRNVYAMNDGGRWDFEASGEQQPFEKSDAYLARRIRDRFTRDMLRDYLHALGIDVARNEFYHPQRAYLVETKFMEGDREFTLAEAQDV